MEPFNQIGELQYGDHLGHLYEDFDERIALVATFFKEGLARGDKCVCFVEEAALAGMREGLAAALQPQSEQGKSYSVLTGWYRGEDDPQATEERLEEVYSQAVAEGFKGLRLVVDVGWVVQAGPALLTKREGLAGHWCVAHHSAIVICQYNAASLAPELLQPALRTHPRVILKRRVVPNTYCEPAELTTQAATLPQRVQWMLDCLGRIAKDAAALGEREQRARFLAEACVLLGSSLDLNTIFKRVADLAIPVLADMCIVDIVDETGKPQRVAVSSIDPEVAKAVHEHWLRHRAEPGSFPVLRRVLSSGSTEIQSEVSEEFRTRAWSDPEHPQVAPGFDWRSFMMVPLMAHGRVLGAISLHITDAPRRYEASDLAFAESLAQAVALALDNARLHSEAQQSAARRERLRMAGEMHDTLSQSLFSAGLKLDWSSHQLGRRSKVRARLEEIRRDIGVMMEQVRGFTAPTSPEKQTVRRLAKRLATRIRALVAQFQELTQTAITLQMDAGLDRLNAAKQEILYRAVREALTNVAKHAHASRATVSVRQSVGEITFEVVDNGVGSRGARANLNGKTLHFGLRHMAAEFVEKGGRLQAGPVDHHGFRLAGALPITTPKSR
jgi:signal transduction histidine kinase